MKYEIMSENELEETRVGAAITVASILAILCAAAVAIILYRVFMSKKGSASIGGWKFTWD